MKSTNCQTSEIPCDIISSILEIEKVDNYQEMIEDLKIIKEHKDAYIKLTQERVSKLVLGSINKNVASELYRKNYEDKKKLHNEKLVKRVNSYQLNCKGSNNTSSKKEEVKQLLYEIKIK